MTHDPDLVIRTQDVQSKELKAEKTKPKQTLVQQC